jgi:hypothetical protein
MGPTPPACSSPASPHDRTCSTTYLVKHGSSSTDALDLVRSWIAPHAEDHPRPTMPRSETTTHNRHEGSQQVASQTSLFGTIALLAARADVQPRSAKYRPGSAPSVYIGGSCGGPQLDTPVTPRTTPPVRERRTQQVVGGVIDFETEDLVPKGVESGAVAFTPHGCRRPTPCRGLRLGDSRPAPGRPFLGACNCRWSGPYEYQWGPPLTHRGG